MNLNLESWMLAKWNFIFCSRWNHQKDTDSRIQISWAMILGICQLIIIFLNQLPIPLGDQKIRIPLQISHAYPWRWILIQIPRWSKSRSSLPFCTAVMHLAFIRSAVKFISECIDTHGTKGSYISSSYTCMTTEHKWDKYTIQTFRWHPCGIGRIILSLPLSWDTIRSLFLLFLWNLLILKIIIGTNAFCYYCCKSWNQLEYSI